MIFISHSSRDHEAAAALHAQLIARAYDPSQLFLDSDVDSGIAAGESWQQILYTRLKDCRALIVLCTQAWLDSKWCFAELVYAKANGKEVFPVILEPCDFRGVLAEHQAVFVHRDGDAAYERLWRALDARHLGPRDDFGWPPADGDRCPFPGLMSFDERHAGVFFGREAETQSVLEELRKMRANGEPRLLMITGGSGSGKSSLLKAGVLPQLKHKSSDTEWLVLPVLRYGQAASPQHTVFDQLAMNVAGENWKSLRDADAKSFVDAVQDLIVARGSMNATVVLPIDQFEELLAPAADANAFLEFLREVFGCTNGRLLAIGTLRSDHLDVYERHPSALTAPYVQSWRLGPFPRERVRDVIVKPAARAHVEVASDLLDRLERDTPTAESLPLLAFTLEKLYRRSANDGRLDLHEYEGMERAIEKSAEAAAPPSLPADVLSAVRLTFVKHLASVNDKDEVVRTIARWSDVPDAAKPVLERFVAERLLTKNEHGIEVAHEALFRAWPTLRTWLSDAADILRWRRDVQRDRTSDPEWKSLRPAQLAVAKPWLRTRRNELTNDELSWIRRSIGRERVQRAFAALIAVVILGFGITTLLLKFNADEASQNNLGKYLASQSAEIARTTPRNYNLSLLLAIEGYQRDPSAVTAARLRSAMAETPLPIARMKMDSSIDDLKLSPDGRWLATVEKDFVRVWDVEHEREMDSTPNKMWRISWRTDGQLLLTDANKHFALWNWQKKAAPVAIAAPAEARWSSVEDVSAWLKIVAPREVYSLIEEFAVTQSGERIAFSDRTLGKGWIYVRETSNPEPAADPFPLGAELVSKLLFHPDGRALAINSFDGPTRIWDWKSNRVLATHESSGIVDAIAFSRDGALVAEVTSSSDSSAFTLWNAATGRDVFAFRTAEVLRYLAAIRIEFSADGRYVIVCMGDSAVRVFAITDTGVRPLYQFAADAVAVGVDVDANTSMVALATIDNYINAWKLEIGSHAQMFPGVYDVVAAPRGDAIALLGPESRIVDGRTRKTIVRLGHNSEEPGPAVFSKSGQTFACFVESGVVIAGLQSRTERFVVQRAPVTAMRFSDDGQQLLIAQRLGALSSLSVADGVERPLFAIRGLEHATFSADGRFFAEKDSHVLDSGAEQPESPPIHLYDIARAKPLAAIDSDDSDADLIFSPNGSLFASLLDENTLRIWSTERKREVAQISVYGSYRSKPTFDPSGRFIAVADGADVQLNDARSGEEIRRLRQVGGDVHRFSFTPDGSHIAANCQDGYVRIWRVADGDLVMVIPQAHPFDMKDDISFTPDGKSLIVVQNEEARFVIWQREDVLREACRRVVREKLSITESKYFLAGESYDKTCSGGEWSH